MTTHSTLRTQEKGYVYIYKNVAYYVYNVCKLGQTANYVFRLDNYTTYHPMRGCFAMVFEFDTVGMSQQIERLLQHKFRSYHFEGNGGTEFYDVKIEELIEPFLQKMGFKYRCLLKKEIDNTERHYRVKKSIQKLKNKKWVHSIRQCIQQRDEELREEEVVSQQEQYEWHEREYQTVAIQHCKTQIAINDRVYLELPTGGGKTAIAFRVFCEFEEKTDLFLILSPRKAINEQNIGERYLSLLKHKPAVFNYSSGSGVKGIDSFLRRSGKKVMVCCIQSMDEVHAKLLEHNQTNIFVWFDEAHYGVEKCVELERIHCEKTQFWLNDKTHIAQRLFTSASPDRDLVKANVDAFGELYSPIKVKELIVLNWLANIQPYIFAEEKQNIDKISSLLLDFAEKSKRFGMSFHKRQQTAFDFFWEHQLLFDAGKTTIQPFLLVGDDFTDPRMKDIALNYHYRNIRSYEQSPPNGSGCIGYVVAKYSMGYDFRLLDYICFSDPKFSFQDIIQCIGRGMRPDQLGEHGGNLNKELVVVLPISVDDNADTTMVDDSYKPIAQTLMYLMNDVGIAFDKIVFKDKRRGHGHYTNGKEDAPEYGGMELVKTKMFDYLQYLQGQKASGTTFQQAKKIIADKNIRSREEYDLLCEKDSRLTRDPETAFQGQFKGWTDYWGIDKSRYYDLETCKTRAAQILRDEPTIKGDGLDLSRVCQRMCEKDGNFPPNELWVEFYGVKDLREIMDVSPNRKRNRQTF